MERIPGTKNGYQIFLDSTNDDFKRVLRTYKEVRCIICNSETSSVFKSNLFGRNIVTVNNKVERGQFYVNHLS